MGQNAKSPKRHEEQAARIGKARADVLVLEQNLAQSRTQAQALILAGQVLLAHNAQRVEKPGTPLGADTELMLKGAPPPYVSRGGLKLAGALAQFNIDVHDQICLDIGASTGGFTDCLIKHGAKRVYAVDVGYNQMAYSLRQNTNVIVLERVNMRYATKSLLPEKVGVVVADVSFISLKLILPNACQFLQPGASMVVLVKPQFEVGRQHIGKGGIVRDPQIRQQAALDMQAFVQTLGMRETLLMDSPITGTHGNHEYLLFGRYAN